MGALFDQGLEMMGGQDAPENLTTKSRVTCESGQGILEVATAAVEPSTSVRVPSSGEAHAESSARETLEYLMRNRKGWSAWKTGARALLNPTMTAVAAAASVPSSFTCRRRDRKLRTKAPSEK